MLQVLQKVLCLQRERENGNYHIVECAYGSFERAISLPARLMPTRVRRLWVKLSVRDSFPETLYAALVIAIVVTTILPLFATKAIYCGSGEVVAGGDCLSHRFCRRLCSSMFWQ